MRSMPHNDRPRCCMGRCRPELDANLLFLQQLRTQALTTATNSADMNTITRTSSSPDTQLTGACAHLTHSKFTNNAPSSQA